MAFLLEVRCTTASLFRLSAILRSPSCKWEFFFVAAFDLKSCRVADSVLGNYLSGLSESGPKMRPSKKRWTEITISVVSKAFLEKICAQLVRCLTTCIVSINSIHLTNV